MKTSQDIEIRTVSGTKFDMLAGETVEMVMGGFSLLDLSLRFTDYTTSFKLPRTPTNENILGFASETTRYNHPNLEVFVRFGTKDLVGYLKVLSFDKGYSVSITFTSFIKNLSVYTLNDIIGDIQNPIFISSPDSPDPLQDLIDKMIESITYSFFHHYSDKTTPFLPEMGIFINQKKIIEMICGKIGYTASIDIGVNLTDKYLFARDWYYEMINISPEISVMNIKKRTDIQSKLISELLKEICLLNGIYFTIDELTKIVSFYEISKILTNESINIETLQITEKRFYTGHGYKNNINYSVGDDILETTNNAIFYSDGTETKESLKLKFLIPSKSDSGHYILTNVKELVAASKEGDSVEIVYDADVYNIVFITTQWLTIPDLAPIYSFMTDVFNETNVITADGYIDSLKVEDVMKNRVIRSIGLGGTYFVETLNYNINTGKSVLTLIKI